MKNFWRLLPITLFVVTLSCKNESAQQENITQEAPAAVISSFSLACESLTADGDTPRSAISFINGDRKIKIKELNGTCMEISAEQRTIWEVPAEAQSAIYTWWAGAGDGFYAVRDSNLVKIYTFAVDEESTGTPEKKLMGESAGVGVKLLAH